MKRTTPRFVTLLAVSVSAALLGGCVSVWEKNYRPISTAAKLGDGAPVELREIPWDRMEKTIVESQQRAAESDVHPLDWSDERKLEARSELLRNLQVSADPSRAQVIGVSSFRTTDQVRPWDGEIKEFARRAGANYVVWSDRYIGKADVIVDYTVTGSSIGSRGRRDPNEADRTTWRSDSYTVPLVVSRDERGYTAFFIRLEEQ